MRRPGARMLLLACALACTCAAAGPIAAAYTAPATGGTAISVTDLRTRLEQAQRILAQPRAAIDTTAAAADLADRVEALLPATIRVAEGTRTIDVDLSSVTDRARDLRQATTSAKRTAVIEALSSHVTALRSAMGSGAADTTTDPSDPAALGELVAALPRSSNTVEDWMNTQIERILNWIAGWLDGLNPGGAPSAGGANRVVMLLVLAVPALLGLIVLVRALLARRRRAAAGSVPGAGAPAGTPAVAAAADLPQDALGYARSLAAAGAHRDAVRALYGGAARHLVDAGAVTRMRTRTSLEMLRDVAAAAPALAAPFEDLTGDFERAWYGHADPGGAGFERALAEYGRVVDAATVRRPPASPDVATEGDEAR